MKLFCYITRFLAVVLIILVTGCDSKPPEQPKTAASITKKVNFFHYFSGPLSGGIQEMVATVNKTNKGYTVLASGLDHEAFKTMIPTSLNRGTPPELFSYWAGERVRQLVNKNQLLEIDDLWAKENLSTSFSPAIIDSAVTYYGKKYLLPITQHIVVFFFNKKIFADLGLKPPDSWLEFLALCDRLRQHDISPIALGARERWPAQFWFDYLLLRTAGPDFRTRLLQGLESFTNPQVTEVYQMWSEMLQHGYFNNDANNLDWAEATRLVQVGKAAMTLMGTWSTQVLDAAPESLVPGRDYDFFAFPMIDPKSPRVAVGPIDGIVISSASENHEFAKNVLAYFASAEAQKIMSVGSGALAPNNTIPDSFYSPFKLKLKQEIDRADQWAFNLDLSTSSAVAERILDSFNEIIEFPTQYRKILEDLQTDITAHQ